VFLLSTTEGEGIAYHKKPKPALPPSPALDGSCSNRMTSRMMSSKHLDDGEPRLFWKNRQETAGQGRISCSS